jgi:hypothetical protein
LASESLDAATIEKLEREVFSGAAPAR